MRPMRQTIMLVPALLLLAGPGPVHAADAAIGTTGAQFLELPAGARAIAMGAAGAAISRDATAIYYNPAGLAGMQETSLSLMQAFYFQNISYQFGAIAGKLGGDTVYGFGVQHLSPGAIGEVDNTGSPTGDSLHPADLAVAAGFGRQFGILDAGLAGKYISSRIDGTASTFAGDAGLRLNISKNAALAGSVSNIGTGLKYRGRKEALPTLARAGASFKFKNVLLAADLLKPGAGKMYFAGGTEFCAFQTETAKFLLRAGYNSRNAAGDPGGSTGFSAGTGFDLGRFSVDYSYTPFGGLGNSHRISLGMRFAADRDDGAVNAAAYFAPGSRAVVAAGNASLYSHPDKGTRVVAVLRRGEEVKVVEVIGNWVKAAAPYGGTGWLPRAELGKGR